MKSMTGHGRGEALHKGYKATVEITSVNRKQLEVQVNLPREFERHETAVRERIQQRLSRGRVSVRVTVLTAQGEEINRVIINQHVAQEGVRALRELAADVGLEDTLSIDTLMRLPGFVRVESSVEDADIVAPAIRKAVDQALKGLLEMRQAEGE